ncbi:MULTISPECIES: hypothetical protein [Nocardia]|uniref:Uncharacterized protein n=1 Tax=Nocardia aurea TaxID=2144174 RepID=A0ABV3FQ04_9NOCA|nr:MULTISPECIES: hypothetical protein [Nocardia]
MARIWLARNNRFEWVLYDTGTGRVHHTLRPETRSAPTAGLIARCLGRTVAFYVNADRTGYVVQSGDTAVPLDDRTSVRYWKTRRNYFAHLLIEHGDRRLKLDELTFTTAADEPSDEVSSKDFLGTINDFATREERRRHGLTVWSQSADPTAEPGAEETDR